MIYDPDFISKFRDKKLFGLSKKKKDQMYTNKNSIESSLDSKNEKLLDIPVKNMK